MMDGVAHEPMRAAEEAAGIEHARRLLQAGEEDAAGHQVARRQEPGQDPAGDPGIVGVRPGAGGEDLRERSQTALSDRFGISSTIIWARAMS